MELRLKPMLPIYFEAQKSTVELGAATCHIEDAQNRNVCRNLTSKVGSTLAGALMASFPDLPCRRDPSTQSGKPLLILHPALMRTVRDAHVLPVFRDRAASDLDALRLQDAGDLLVGERPGWIFFVDELLNTAFQDQQRSVAAFGPFTLSLKK